MSHAYKALLHPPYRCIKSSINGQPIEWIPLNDKEWVIPERDLSNFNTMEQLKSNTEFKHSICVEFSSDIYGTFRQTVAFDFGLEPLMVKHLCVDVRPASFASNVDELKKVSCLESPREFVTIPLVLGRPANCTLLFSSISRIGTRNPLKLNYSFRSCSWMRGGMKTMLRLSSFHLVRKNLIIHCFMVLRSSSDYILLPRHRHLL